MDNFSILVPTLKSELWHNTWLKEIPKHSFSYIETKFTEIRLDSISGCYHPRYANRTWMQALLNLKRFEDHIEGAHEINKSTIVGHQICEEIYIFDHHRPIMARFLGYSTIKAQLYVYK